METSEILASLSYWLIVGLWAAILGVLLGRASYLLHTDGVTRILVIVLAIDAFRNLFENLYFGAFFNSYYGLLPASWQAVLAAPSLLVIPKTVNLLAALLVLFLLLRRWLPLLALDRTAMALKAQARAHEADTRDLARERENLLIAQAVANVGSWETDLDTLEVKWSDQAFRIFGLDAGTFRPTHQGFLAYVHPEDRAHVDTAFRRSFGTSAPQSVDHRIVRPDGQVRHLAERWQVFSDATGKPMCAIGTCQDVTELRRAERQAEDSAHLLRLAGRAARLGGWFVDLNGPSLTWSKETAELHEIADPEQITVQRALQFYVPEDRERIAAAFEACAREGTPYDETCRLVTAKGRMLWVRAIGEASRDASGKIITVQGAIQDITDVVEARQHASQLSERLYRMLDDISDPFMTIDRQWRVTFVNRRGRDLLTAETIDVAGRLFWDVFPRSVEGGVAGHLRHAMESGEAKSFETYSRSFNRWFDASVYPGPEGLALHVRDITPLKSQRDQLQLLETAIGRLNDFVMITDAQSIDEPGPRIVYVNDALVAYTGYSRDELLGQSPRIFQGPRTQRDVLDQVRAALAARKGITVEIINYSKQKEEYWVELAITPIFDGAGNATHFVSIERDISARKANELQIRMNESRFRTVAQLTADIVWDWDLAADTIWRNDAGGSRFGYPGNEPPPPSSTWKERIHPDDRDRVLHRLSADLETGAARWAEDYRLLRADGTYAQVEARGSIIRSESGGALRIIGSTKDVTEKRLIEERLRKSQKLEAVGQLTGGVAHDFNNILMVIMANVDSILEGEERDPSSRLESISRAVERATKLTRQLLAFSRRQALQLEVVDLNASVVETGALLRRTLSANIEIGSLLQEGLWLTLADRGQLEAALVNLCVNARDAMPDGGRLTIQTRDVTIEAENVEGTASWSPGEYVRLTVSDTGCGMSPEVLSRVFEPFFTTKDVGKGTGLGLSMVYGFVRQCGGHVEIDSEVDRGTIISIYFPRFVGEAQRAAPPNLEGVPSGRERLLVVEDEEPVRQLVVNQLTTLGYQVANAADAAAALELLSTGGRFDLLLTDVIMPGPLNGRQLSDEARAINPEMKVLFMSGYSEDFLSTKGVLSDGITLISKPFRKADLARKVRQLLDE